jgi:hypothetical protein
MVFFSTIINYIMSKSAFIPPPFLIILLRWIPLLLRLSLLVALIWGLLLFGQWAWQAFLNSKEPITHIKTKSGQHLELSSTLEEDERALLLLRFTTFLTLVQQQSYGQLYDTWAGESLKKSPANRSVFMKMAYCSERFLGKAVAYNKSAVIVLKVVKPMVVYHVIVQTEREKANANEKFVLLPYGLDYRWVGYYVSSPNSDFQACIKTIAHPRKPTAELSHPN